MLSDVNASKPQDYRQYNQSLLTQLSSNQSKRYKFLENSSSLIDTLVQQATTTILGKKKAGLCQQGEQQISKEEFEQIKQEVEKTSYNIQLLDQLGQKKSKQCKALEKVTSVNHMLRQSAEQVLGKNLSPYFKGEFKIDKNTYRKIDQAFAKQIEVANYNIKLLEKLASKNAGKSKHLSKAIIWNLIEQSAVNVLRDISPYLEGTVKINHEQYSLIKKEFAQQKAMYISSTNLAFLHNITLRKSSKYQGTIDLSTSEKLVAKAAATVLGTLTPFQKGKALITEKQSLQIEKEFEKIKNQIGEKVKAKEKYLTETAEQYKEMTLRLRSRAHSNEIKPDPKNPEFQTLLEDYYQIMGCVLSYGKWEIGETILGPHEDLPNFKVQEVIKNDRGLQIVILVPDLENDTDPQEALRPIFCCRGTTANPHNLIDDLNAHIGQYSFEESKEDIRTALEKVSGTKGAVITGHSLGGAIAQNLVAEFCDQVNEEGHPLIQSVYHFNAPGVGEVLVDQYKSKVKDLEARELPRPKVYSVTHVGDLVSLAGGDHIADIKKFVGKFSFLKILIPKFILQAHSWRIVVSEFQDARLLKEFTSSRKFFRSFTEKIRRACASIFRQSIEKQILAKQKLKESSTTLLGYLSDSAETRRHTIDQRHQKKEKRRIQRIQNIHSIASNTWDIYAIATHAMFLKS